MSRFESRNGRSSRRLAAGGVVILLALAAVLFSLRAGTQPVLSIESELPGLGRRTPVTVSVTSSGRGLAYLAVSLRQGERSELLLERRYDHRPVWAFWGPRTVAESVLLEVGSETVVDLQQGMARVEVEARAPGTWLRKPPTARASREYEVILRPPLLEVISSQHYPAQGGAEAVVYRVGASSVRDGVRAGELFFAGYPLSGGSDDLRFALFAVPFDLDTPESIRLEAEDALGNQAQREFVDKFFPRPFRSDRIEVSERFMAGVVPEIQANTAGLRGGTDLLADYLTINRELRRANAETLRELAGRSRQEFLWSRRFEGLPNAKVMSAFADRRTYIYDGEEIDRQDHLGFDLASVKRAPIPAANAGIVILARYFGIYGNAVVIDHGYGLMSLYGHLSSIAVDEGQEVERGEVIGRTGETGLAAGDHLHFTMLLGGEAVNPIEWWDAKWLRDRLKRKLGAAMPYAE